MLALLALFVTGIGLMAMLSPRTAWWLGEGWKFRDAEPSDFALLVYRAGGGIVFLLGLWLLVAPPD